MIKLLTLEQVKTIALDLKLPMCDCGCNRPSWRVMEFYWDIANEIKKLNEKNDKTMTDITLKGKTLCR